MNLDLCPQGLELGTLLGRRADQRLRFSAQNLKLTTSCLKLQRRSLLLFARQGHRMRQVRFLSSKLAYLQKIISERSRQP